MLVPGFQMGLELEVWVWVPESVHGWFWRSRCGVSSPPGCAVGGYHHKFICIQRTSPETFVAHLFCAQPEGKPKQQETICILIPRWGAGINILTLTFASVV